MPTSNNQSLWVRANSALRQKEYKSAVALYEQALNEADDSLKARIRFNLDLSRRRMGMSVSTTTSELEKPEGLDEFYFNLIKQGNFFDPAWYLTQYKDKYHVTGNPLAHYLAHGIAFSINPSPHFDTAYYLKTHQDVTTSGTHPFLHYVCQGHKEDRPAKPVALDASLDQYLVEAPQYVPRLAPDASPVEKAARVIAFYLPQFHPVPENDAWWGTGFTEWTNVNPAKPQFAGHYQPHVPDDFLGHYDLRDTAVMHKQIELAKQYGIEGFCFYTYWFTGTRLLETPVDNYLADATLDHPFCICWANENWSRRWDGLDNDLLMVQHYSDQDDIAFIAHMAKYLRDPRYIRIQGKPLLIVYRPNLFPSMNDTAQRWRDWCRENGLGEIYIAYVQSFEKRDPTEYGLDAAIEFPPNNSAPPDITEKFVEPHPDFAGKVYDWRVFLQRSENYAPENYTVFRGTCPSWDNTARKKERGAVFAHSSPKLFERWLINAFEDTVQRSEDIDQRLVFINAWNEWAEGAHLEPDRRHGYAWLQAVRQAHMQICTSSRNNAHASHTLQKPDDLDAHIYEVIKSSCLFHPAWYLERYKASQHIEGNPLSHYLKHGVAESLNPSQRFDTAYYLAANPDLANADIHPFIHYVLQGIKEGRSPTQASPLYRVEPIEYIPRLPSDTIPVKKAVKVISFYLPQFHPIPENDAWWGKGFTEWTNVCPAKPQFEGHYQPHIPDDFLGYYDLRDTSVMRKQIELAKQYGIEGFCFYTYWFSGHRLLETPVDNYLGDSTLDLPFCICWANENWSRRWDGRDNEILIEQEYSADDDLAFIQNTSKYLKDNRYIRIQGRPLLLVYRPNLFPNIKETTSRWRSWCRSNGIGEIYIAYPQSFSEHDPAEYGMDAAIEFPPSGWYARQELATDIQPAVDQFEAMVYDWRFMLARSDAYRKPEYKLLRGVTPSWDNTARRKNKGTVFHHSSPKLFTKWLTNAFSDTLCRIDDQDEQIVFINAWNEWAEGAHLEPDQRYGYAWLQAVRDAHAAVLKKQRQILLVSHDARPHGAQYLILEIGRLLRDIGYLVTFLALDGGILLDDFIEVGQTLNAKAMDEDAVRDFLSNYHAQGADIAITSTVVSGGMVPLLKSSGYKVLSLIHELPGVIRQMKQEENARTISQLADRLVFPAQMVYELFAEIAPFDSRKLVIRPQGVLRTNPYKNRKQEARRLICGKHNLKNNTQIVLNIAFADSRKGADLFIEIAALTLKVQPNTTFIWVGHSSAEMQPKIEQRIYELNLQDRVLFVGFDKEPMAYYAAATVLALTSREDPFPNVVLEAAEVGVPVLAFEGATGAGDFIVDHGGRLSPYSDINAYSRELCALLVKPAPEGRPPVGTLQRYVLDLLHEVDNLHRVSVVVPNYNYEQHINARLDSVCQQKYQLYELIVLDDQSTDGSVSVIDRYLDTLTCDRRLIANEKNSGSVFRQWQRGLALSSGDLVWIAEADDLCEPDMLAMLVPAFDDPDVVLAYCQSQQIDEHGVVLANDYLDYTGDVSDKWKEDHVADGLEEIGHALAIKNTIPNVSAVVFRRTALVTALETIGDQLFDYRVAGDWLVYMHVLRQGKAFYSSRSLNKHRRHTISVTNVTSVQRHMQEVLEMQQTARSLANTPSTVLEKARAYAARLKKHFGLVQE
jgi:lipopolysaccharide biosynthesis protein/glycosyltransferase involved in cell wall biosynthesis